MTLAFAGTAKADTGFGGLFDDSLFTQSGPNTQYVSWCEEPEKVMAEGPNGQPLVQADCTASGKVCQESAEYISPRHEVLISARCVQSRP